MSDLEALRRVRFISDNLTIEALLVATFAIWSLSMVGSDAHCIISLPEQEVARIEKKKIHNCETGNMLRCS
jgi:hypothetical protein